MPELGDLSSKIMQGENNPINRILATETKQRDLAGAEPGINGLDSLTSQPGDLVGGRFISPDETASIDANGQLVSEPTDPLFTGAFQSGRGETFGGVDYQFGAVLAGVLGAGFNKIGQLVAGAGTFVADVAGMAIKTVGGATFISFTSTRALFGSDISAANTTALAIFFTAQTYNSESMEAGTILQGSNSANYGNILWRPSTKLFETRNGTTMIATINATGIALLTQTAIGTFRIVDNSARVLYDLKAYALTGKSTMESIVYANATGTIKQALYWIRSFSQDNSEASLQVEAHDTGDTRFWVIAKSVQVNGEDVTTRWNSVSDTWAYASASTITIPTDGTTTYQKGDKLRFKQGGVYKYYVIASLTATVITIIVNTDYTVANSAITNIAFTRSENAFGWPGTFTRLPTYSASGGGTATTITTNFCKYRTFGTRFIQDIDVTLVTKNTMTGIFQFDIPVTPNNVMTGYGRENATTGSQLQLVTSGTTVLILRYDNTAMLTNGYRFFCHIECEF